MKDLNLYPTEDLFNELDERFENIVIVGEKEATKSKGRVDSKHYAGNILKCFGLLELMKEFLLREYRKGNKTVDVKET